MDASIAKCGVLAAPKVLYNVPVGGNPTGACYCMTAGFCSSTVDVDPIEALGLAKWSRSDNGARKGDALSATIMDCKLCMFGWLHVWTLLRTSSRNPCCAGTVTSEKRKRQIYAVAQEYNLLIIEDDPYYLLQYRNGMPQQVPLLSGCVCT